MSPSILEQIKQYKLKEIDTLKKNNGLELLEKKALTAMPPRDFFNKLTKMKIPKVNIIAEIKKASPSKGIINKNFEPAVIAQIYQESGASCISVLTDSPSFKGKPEHLKIAKENSDIPILRKDFIFDEIQVFESRSMGADCILIIMAALSNSEAQRIETLAFDLKMSVILEVHNKKELDRALNLKSRLIGINNRDLNTFETNLETTINLNEFIPEGYHVISESGLSNSTDIKKMCENGINTFLIGETFMKSNNIKDEFKKLLG
ncbi:MAG: indole-3-glycerol phosphate synthase TrpC [Paracoccaceae bacterium]|nr:indole-3-glycerol phosphate synthase TrpC [Paracoccaceae bacterium]